MGRGREGGVVVVVGSVRLGRGGNEWEDITCLDGAGFW